MNRLQFLINTSLAGVIALCILLQIVFVRMTQSDDLRLKQTEASLEQGQMCVNRLQQIAGRVAQVAQAQNDQALKDLLTRQNFQIKQNSTTTTPTTTPAADATSTH